LVGIASAATALLSRMWRRHAHDPVAQVGFMLPNHSPLVIAEQFGTLESTYPEELILDLDDAGTRSTHVAALRADPMSADRFPHDVGNCAIFEPAQPAKGAACQVSQEVPVPLWILGSSLFGAQLAGILGLPYAFASHFAPAALIPALQAYRREFKPSKQLERSYAAAGVNVFAQILIRKRDDYLLPRKQSFTRMVRGTRGRLPPPIDDIESFWTPFERRRLPPCSTGHSSVRLNGARRPGAFRGRDRSGRIDCRLSDI